jgi:hypothetical protein
MYYELGVRYDARQSFYGKAKVEESRGCKTLYSYDTPVMRINRSNQPVFLQAWDYSQTTLRHCKEFLRQNGFWVDNKADMLKLCKDYSRIITKNTKTTR